MAISDTTPEIEAMQLEIRRKMTMAQRWQVALEISDLSLALRKAGLRREHPEWSERQIILELFRRQFLPKPLPASLQ
jgi:Rv0078B-related antitoxin